jgi:hypothetical protein
MASSLSSFFSSECGLRVHRWAGALNGPRVTATIRG